LVDNNIVDAGARSLALALDKNTTLTKLKLPYNNIGEAGVAIAADLVKTATFTLLDLRLSKIGRMRGSSRQA
jgi:hypothetical protein